jgi:CPA2 family monovalent cation:H+ antiporter-2
MDELSVLITFAVGLAAALFFGYIAVRLKLSPIIGYLLAGIIVGPFTSVLSSTGPLRSSLRKSA